MIYFDLCRNLKLFVLELAWLLVLTFIAIKKWWQQLYQRYFKHGFIVIGQYRSELPTFLATFHPFQHCLEQNYQIHLKACTGCLFESLHYRSKIRPLEFSSLVTIQGSKNRFYHVRMAEFRYSDISIIVTH